MELLDLAPLLGIPAVVKILDAYRQLVTDRDFVKVAYTVGAWVVGFGLVFLVSQSSLNPLGELNIADMVLLGVGAGATASVVHDFASRGEYSIEAEVDEFEGDTPPGV